MDFQSLKLVISLVFGLKFIQGTTAVITLSGLPGTVSVPENSPASTVVFNFNVSIINGAPLAIGYPQILNTNPLTHAFIVSMVSTSKAQVTISGTPVLDFETAPNSFILQIIAVDGAGAAAVGALTVLLEDVDEAPVFLDEDSVIYVLENSPPGEIYQPSASDPEKKPLTFDLTPSNLPFSIDKDKGSLSITDVLDYETDPRRYRFDLSVSDGTHTAVRTLTVQIVNTKDDKPQFLNKITAFTVPEELTPGHIITNITAVVPEDTFSTENILYIIRSNNYLAIHAWSVNLDVTVTPVNEYPPVFTPPSYFYTISELLGRGAVIGQVNATDRDLPATDITYSFIFGGGASDLRNIFHLDPELGTIALLTRPDYEVTQTYQLVIRAVDGDPVRPLSATTTVTVNITEANDEPPLCGPNNTNLIVPVDLRPGSNVQSVVLTCRDKDSPPASFIYTISGASNLNSHFVFSPASGTNVTRLILREPFDFAGGVDRVWKYSLTVLISDANLMAGEPEPRDEPQTGTVVINIQVFDPDLTTTTATTTPPRVSYIAVRENTFDVNDWYVTFLGVLGALLLLGILGYLLYRCGRYLSTLDCSCCDPPPMKDKAILVPEKGPVQRETITEITKIFTVFDGEAVDPVTGRTYEYNTKSGARRWKDVSTEPDIIQVKSSAVVVPEKEVSPVSSKITSGSVRAGSAQSEMRNNEEESTQGSPRTNKRARSRPQSSRSTARPRSRNVPMAALEAINLSAA